MRRSRAVGAHPPSLYRLLRALAAMDVVAQAEDGRFALTPVGELLRSDHPDSQRAWIVAQVGGWGALLHAVRTGEPAFQHAFGVTLWEHADRDPEYAAGFDRVMARGSAAQAAALVRGYDLAPFRTVVDVGGGSGTLLVTVLQAHPHVRGVLFDRPAALARAAERLAAAGMAHRCDVVAGDFFREVPAGGDAYVLKSVVHDWDDEPAIRLLATCRRAMAGPAKLLLVEGVLPERMTPGAFPPAMDLNMLVMPGGKERTESEFRALLAAAGLTLTRVLFLQARLGVVEAST